MTHANAERPPHRTSSASSPSSDSELQPLHCSMLGERTREGEREGESERRKERKGDWGGSRKEDGVKTILICSEKITEGGYFLPCVGGLRGVLGGGAGGMSLLAAFVIGGRGGIFGAMSPPGG